MARILVVDDDSDALALMDLSLTIEGHDVTSADGGGEALACCRATRFDMIITDVLMPGMSGLDVASWIRTEGPDPELPIIMVTSLGSAADRQRGADAGADVYLVKPFDGGELAASVSNLLTASAGDRLAVGHPA